MGGREGREGAGPHTARLRGRFCIEKTFWVATLGRRGLSAAPSLLGPPRSSAHPLRVLAYPEGFLLNLFG